MHLRSDRETVVTLELSLYLLKHKFGSYCFPASNLKFQTVSTFFPLQKLQTLHLFLTICCQSPQDGRLVKKTLVHSKFLMWDTFLMMDGINVSVDLQQQQILNQINAKWAYCGTEVTDGTINSFSTFRFLLTNNNSKYKATFSQLITIKSSKYLSNISWF